MELNKNLKYIGLFLLGALFCSLVFHFNSYLYRFADMPDSDEFFSLSNALGKVDYPFGIGYLFILKIFAFFKKDFFSLYEFNFSLVHLLFPFVFFLYNTKNKISTGHKYIVYNSVCDFRQLI